jgi:CubicO group peptidase (beta-lactamase class C family)
VDARRFDWDTTVHSLRGDFQLPDARLSETLQVQQLMNMGSGILDIPFLQYGDQDSPEYLWHSVRDLKVIAPPETTYHYNNTIYALGGYVGALAVGLLHFGDESENLRSDRNARVCRNR